MMDPYLSAMLHRFCMKPHIFWDQHGIPGNHPQFLPWQGKGETSLQYDQQIEMRPAGGPQMLSGPIAG